MKILFIALIAAIISPTVLADTSGRVDGIDYTKRTVVIDDTFYRLSKNLEIIDADGKKTTLFALQRGNFVEGKTSAEAATRSTITLLRILKSAPVKNDDDRSERED